MLPNSPEELLTRYLDLLHLRWEYDRPRNRLYVDFVREAPTVPGRMVGMRLYLKFHPDESFHLISDNGRGTHFDPGAHPRVYRHQPFHPDDTGIIEKIVEDMSGLTVKQLTRLVHRQPLEPTSENQDMSSSLDLV